jgi:5'-nucleotidase
MSNRKLLAALAFSAVFVGAVSAQDDTFALTIMHTNDQHSHHLPNNAGDGGVARLLTVVTQVEAGAENFLLLDAGDRFTGTLFHQQYRGQDNAQIMGALGYDAMALGNHEFDDGDDVLAAFIDAVDFPVLSANVTVSEDGPLAGRIAPYTVLDVNGEAIGVIGLTTADTATIASPGEGTEFSSDYAGIVNAAAADLTAQGVNKIVLLSHIGYGVDVELAPQLTGVDVIIGGHSHTLLSNAYTAGEAAYPFEATSASGEPIFVVQAGGGSSVWVGQMDLEFDAAGVITSFDGDTILLSRFITPDPVMQAVVDQLNAPLQELRATVIGQSSVFMVGDRAVCRTQECNLGNLIADALRRETNAQIAITNGGGIRASIPNEDTPEGSLDLATPYDVTLGDVLTVLPFGNLASTFDLTGADVIAAIEHGVSAVGADSGTGRFPQVSGIRYTFDPAQPVGSRVVSVEVMAEDGSFSPIDPETVYSVASNDFLRQGGDGYTMFAENAIDPYDFGRPLDQIVADYITNLGPVAPVLDGRIVVVGAE